MELKTDAALGKVPVVLMWSGFMELDEDKFQASLANGRLEKPFDVTSLRKLVSELVPKTQTQRLSEFLTFPKMPELEEKPPQTKPQPQALHQAQVQPQPQPQPRREPMAAAPEPASLPDLMPEEEFEQIPIQKMKSGAERFRIPITNEDADLPIDLQEPSEPIDVENIFREVDEPEEFQVRENRTITNVKIPKSQPPPPPKAAPAMPRPAVAARSNLAAAPLHEPMMEPPQIPALSEAELERIVRAQAKETIENIVWKVLPELAQQIIEREIQKLLKERDGSLY